MFPNELKRYTSTASHASKQFPRINQVCSLAKLLFGKFTKSYLANSYYKQFPRSITMCQTSASLRADDTSRELISSGISQWTFSVIFQRTLICLWYVPKDSHLSSGCLMKLYNGCSVALSNACSCFCEIWCVTGYPE